MYRELSNAFSPVCVACAHQSTRGPAVAATSPSLHRSFPSSPPAPTSGTLSDGLQTLDTDLSSQCWVLCMNVQVTYMILLQIRLL